MRNEVVCGRQADRVPSVIVVDPRFDAYGVLAAAAREGRISLHLRSSGAAALKLARRLPVDAWLVAHELDDMSGHDFVELLSGIDAGRDAGRVAMVGGVPEGGVPDGRLAASGVRAADTNPVLQQPISLADLASLLATPPEDRPAALSLAAVQRSFVTLPVGIGAAVVAVAVLVLG